MTLDPAFSNAVTVNLSASGIGSRFIKPLVSSLPALKSLLRLNLCKAPACFGLTSSLTRSRRCHARSPQPDRRPVYGASRACAATTAGDPGSVTQRYRAAGLQSHRCVCLWLDATPSSDQLALDPFVPYSGQELLLGRLRLSELDLSSNRLGTAAVSAVVSTNLRTDSLRVLNLSNNLLGPEFGPLCSRMMVGCFRLQQLGLSWNSLRPCLEPLARAWESSPSLRTLDLSWNEFGRAATRPALDALLAALQVRRWGCDLWFSVSVSLRSPLRLLFLFLFSLSLGLLLMPFARPEQHGADASGPVAQLVRRGRMR